MTDFNHLSAIRNNENTTLFGINARRPDHKYALVDTIDHAVVTISLRKGDATLVPYHHWDRGFQSVSG